MKSVIFALLAVASISASAQDTTGCKISKDGKYATCYVQDLNTDGKLKKVTFKIRKDSAPSNPDVGCPVGEASYAPCKEGKVPQWLIDLNQAFLDAGFSAPTQEDDNSPGGGN